jgi:hypothetical protein
MIHWDLSCEQIAMELFIRLYELDPTLLGVRGAL